MGEPKREPDKIEREEPSVLPEREAMSIITSAASDEEASASDEKGGTPEDGSDSASSET